MGEHPAAGVFISYSQDDHYIAQTLIELLKDTGYRFWTTLYSVLDDQEWQTLSRNALERSGVCLVLLTPQGLTEPRVLYEMAAARELNRTIIPLIFRTCDIPAELAGLSPVDFRGDIQQARQELIQRLFVLLGVAIQPPEIYPPRKKHEDEIPANIQRIIAGPLPQSVLGSMARQPWISAPQQEDIQMLINAQNDGILPYPEPTPGSGSARDDEIVWESETDQSASAVISRVREYLEKADYLPVDESEKQKRGFPASLLYTRGSALRALLTDSPKQVTTTVAVVIKPTASPQKTCVEIRYALKIPPMWTVTIPERLFWIAEIRELVQAAAGEALNRDESRKRTTAIFRKKALPCFGCYLVLIIPPVFMWLLTTVSPRGEALFYPGILLLTASILAIMLFIAHLGTAWRWSS